MRHCSYENIDYRQEIKWDLAGGRTIRSGVMLQCEEKSYLTPYFTQI